MRLAAAHRPGPARDLPRGAVRYLYALAPGALSSARRVAAILENYTCLSPQHPVRGRDANAILREIMGTTERPRFVEDMIRDFSRLLDEAKFSEASERLDGLRELLGDTDSEVIRAEVALSFLEQGGDRCSTSCAGGRRGSRLVRKAGDPSAAGSP